MHVLKHAELVEPEDVDAKLVDEGNFIFVLEQWHCITGDSIGGGIFVLVEHLFLRLHTNIISDRTVMYDIIQDNVHDIAIQIIRYRYCNRICNLQSSISSYDVTFDIKE